MHYSHAARNSRLDFLFLLSWLIHLYFLQSLFRFKVKWGMNSESDFIFVILMK